MSEEHSEAAEAAISWRDNERVNVTATHVEIEIYQWAPSPKKMIRDLEAENPDNAPPDKLKLRTLVTVDDMMALDDYDYKTEYAGRVALACILSGEIGETAGRLNFDMARRASVADWTIVDRAVQDLLAGKG